MNKRLRASYIHGDAHGGAHGIEALTTDKVLETSVWAEHL